MWMTIGNGGETEFVRPTEILDLNCGIGIVDFQTDAPMQKLTLISENGLQITCKARNHEEYLIMVKMSRRAVKTEMP